MKKLLSFTLTEVLITLVIIGIISAITLPIIMSNHRKIETAAKLKKFQSTMLNAIKLAEIEQGIPFDEWNYGGWNNSMCENIMVKELKPYLNVKLGKFRKMGKYTYLGEQEVAYFSDGTIMYCIGGYSSTSLMGSYKIETKIAETFFDVNGERGPNEIGRDIFAFELSSTLDSRVGRAELKFVPGSQYYESRTRETLINNCKRGGIIYGTYCAALVYRDGWEFKDDYPLRL